MTDIMTLQGVYLEREEEVRLLELVRVDFNIKNGTLI